MSEEEEIAPEATEEQVEVPVEAAKEEENVPENNPLTQELVSQNVSMIAQTAITSQFAYCRLELHQKDITDLSGLLTYPHLRYLDLSDNHLRDINGINALEYLLSFNAAGNRLENIEALDKKKFLQQINLARNKLTSLKGIQTAPLLSFLNLNDNQITQDKILLDNFTELAHFEIRANLISAIPNLSALLNLKRLYLGANQITILKLTNLPNLQILNVRGNQITTIESLENLPQLTYINLRGNKIEKAEEVAKLQELKAIKIIVFSENPLASTGSYRSDALMSLLGSGLSKFERLDKDAITKEERIEVSDALKAAASAGGVDETSD